MDVAIVQYQRVRLEYQSRSGNIIVTFITCRVSRVPIREVALEE